MAEEKIKLSAEIEKRVKYRDILANDIQVAIEKLAKKINEMIDHDLQTYEMLAGPDCLYHDSPISRAFTYEWIAQYMLKNDLDFVGRVPLDGKISIKDFKDRAHEASKWALRFTKEKPAAKSGLEAII